MSRRWRASCARRSTSSTRRTAPRYWYALRFGSSTFGIFDAFPDEEAREAHLAGQVAGALKERAGELLSEEPAIERIDILAGKLDTRALQPQPS